MRAAAPRLLWVPHSICRDDKRQSCSKNPQGTTEEMGRTAGGEGKCTGRGRGWDRTHRDVPPLAGHSQNEPLSLALLWGQLCHLCLREPRDREGPRGAVGAGLRERRGRDVLPPPHSSRAHASISSFGRDRPWCCRSMQINAKLIRVINSAVPQRSYRQGFR